MSELTFLIMVIVAALAYDFVNGFHDAANAIATSIASNALQPKQAIILATVFNFIGALSHTAVAYTIGKGVINSDVVTSEMLFSALLGAIVWNLITWWKGLPSSSTHALVGGLIGSALIHSNFDFSVLIMPSIIKIVLAMLLAPIAAFVGGMIVITIITWVLHGLSKLKPPTNFIFRKLKFFIERRGRITRILLLTIPIFWPLYLFGLKHRPVNRKFKGLQILSAAWMSYTHGMNDAQNAMGIITISLLSYGAIDSFHVPMFIRILCALAMGAGTMFGGWKIIRTIVNELSGEEPMPVQGLSAQVSAGVVIFLCSIRGLPISTSQAISGCVMGTTAANRVGAVNWKVGGNMIVAWIITIPASMIISGLLLLVIKFVH